MIALALALLAPAAGLDPPSWSTPAPPVHVAGNTWEVGSQALSVFVVKTAAGAILIDGGLPGYAPELIKTLAQVGVKPRDVKWILNTHAHFDHSGELAALKTATGAKVAAMAQDVAALETGTYPGSEERKDLNFPPVKVDRVLRDGDTVELGGATLTALLTPGHSAGCTTWTWTERDRGREGGKPLRIALECSTSVALNRLVGRPQYPGIVADYRRSFARLKALPADIHLAPHAEFYGLDAKRAKVAPGAPNPFVDRGELKRTAEASEAAFDKALAAQTAKLGASK